MEPDATFSPPTTNLSLMEELNPDWQRVVGEIGPKLYRYFSANFPSQVAADLVQETLIRLVKKHQAGEFDHSRGSLAALAFGIARFVRLEANRNASGFECLPGDESSEVGSPGPIAHDPDPVAHLRWAIRQLNPVEQEILLRLIDEECQLDQIAHDLAMPLGTVKSHVHRAKEKIRILMETQHE